MRLDERQLAYVCLVYKLPPLDRPSEVYVKSETGETEFSMCIAAGPFTPEADLAFGPLQSLIAKLTSDKPVVVLLVRLTSRYAIIRN